MTSAAETTLDPASLMAELEARLKFETLLAELSAKLINLPAGEIDHQIAEAQRRVCDALGLDVSSLWQWRPDNPEMHTLTHYYRPLGGPPVPPTMNAQEFFPWCLRRVLAREVVMVSSLAELPEEAARDREVLSYYGIKTTLTIPLSTGGGPVFGSVNFNDMRTERRWSGPLVQRLQLVAQIFANALARKVADQALRESEARLSLAADAAEVGLWQLHLATGSFWLTKKTRELFGLPGNEATTFERFLGLVHPDDQSLLRQTVQDQVQSRSVGQVEYRTFRPDGSLRWMLSRGRVHFLASAEPEFLMGVTVDITERKLGELRLRDSEMQVLQLSLAVEQSPVSVVITDTLGKIIYVNRKFSEVSGYSSAECLGQNPRLLKSGECSPGQYQAMWADITGGKTWRGEFHNRKKNGELYWESAVISPLFDTSGRITHFVGVKEDITQRKQTEGRMHDLSRRLIRAHEAERARLARELHDDVTQRLARLAIDAGRVENAPAGTSAADTMRSIREGLVQLSEDIHALSYRLHPSVLEDLGLVEALKAECERFARRETVRIEVDLRKPPTIVPLDPALCLFRVAQEALQNVVRHARARTVKVSLRALDDGLQLAVHDDGIGFVPAHQQDRPSLGLASMRERIALLEGELDIETAPGQGTTIVAWVPLKEPAT